MQSGKERSFRGIGIPFFPEINVYQEEGVLFLSETKERFLISVDERICSNCKGKKAARVLEKDGLLLRLYFKENTARTYLFFELETQRDPGKELFYGQIVFSKERVEDGLKLPLLRELWDGLVLKGNGPDADQGSDAFRYNIFRTKRGGKGKSFVALDFAWCGCRRRYDNSCCGKKTKKITDVTDCENRTGKDSDEKEQ